MFEMIQISRHLYTFEAVRIRLNCISRYRLIPDLCISLSEKFLSFYKEIIEAQCFFVLY